MMFRLFSCTWDRYADEFATYCSLNFNKVRPYATFGTDDFVLLSKDDVFKKRILVMGENDSNYNDYPKYRTENEMYHAAYATSIVLDAYACSTIDEDGRVIDQTINNTNGPMASPKI